MKGIETKCLLLSFVDFENIIKTKAKNDKINIIKVESYDFKALIVRIYLSENDKYVAKTILSSLNIKDDVDLFYKNGLITLTVEKVYESIFNKTLYTTFNNGDIICFVIEK